MEQKERTWQSVNGAARHAMYVSNQGKSNGASSGKQENDFDFSFESRNFVTGYRIHPLGTKLQSRSSCQEVTVI